MAIRATSKTQTTPQRADAKRNRERLLEAADTLFRERGSDVSLDEVARRAGVGIGTLYRHFPTREQLLAAACDERLLALAEGSKARAQRIAPHRALHVFLEELVHHASMYRGLAASFGVVLRSSAGGCHATTEEGQKLLERAQRAGEIRKDASFDDIVCMATAISLAAAQDPVETRRITRLVGMFVDGLRTTRAR